jgi:hypothetical protein
MRERERESERERERGEGGGIQLVVRCAWSCTILEWLVRKLLREGSFMSIGKCCNVADSSLGVSAVKVNWNGIGELEWNWGIGMELDWDWIEIGLELKLDWNWNGIGGIGGIGMICTLWVEFHPFLG